ncbi:hypothetical protein Hanom_Chr11g01013681 [Helianthus anomalus]
MFWQLDRKELRSDVCSFQKTLCHCSLHVMKSGNLIGQHLQSDWTAILSHLYFLKVVHSCEVATRSDNICNPIGQPLKDKTFQQSNNPFGQHSDRVGKGKYWDKGHNVYCLLDEISTKDTVVEEIAKFLREIKIRKALTDKTVMYESHVKTFWNSARYEESDKSIYSPVRKKYENGNDVDLEMKFNVGDLRRVLELGDTDNDPIIISERLAKGMWCRMGFTCHINGKMTKTSFF